jgi:quercetin dioxygenase-like cupin family protein
MPKLIPVDVSVCSLDIFRDLSVKPRQRKPGPPERIDGMTVGILTMSEDAPHDGEMHPDGDEILHVISGKIRVTSDTAPNEDLIMGAGDTCIVPKGEWHKVSSLETTRLIHITPGPNGDHRPLKNGDP